MTTFEGSLFIITEEQPRYFVLENVTSIDAATEDSNMPWPECVGIIFYVAVAKCKYEETRVLRRCC